MSAWASSLLSVALVSLVSLLGLVTISMGEARLRRLSTILMSFAVGALLGDAFIHLLPEALDRPGSRLGTSLLVLGGLLGFFVVEKLLRHVHGPLQRHCDEAERGGPEGPPAPTELAAINLIGDGLHNFIDGVLIAASYLASPTLGLSTTLAVLLHELPQELGDFGVLVHSGLSARKATLLNLASACAAIAGAVVTLLAGAVAGAALSAALLPVAAGGFVYIAAADLIPELQHDRRPGALVTQAGLIAAGIGVMALLTLLE